MNRCRSFVTIRDSETDFKIESTVEQTKTMGRPVTVRPLTPGPSPLITGARGA
ncbi:hypothetical protein SAMN05421753_101448 [Planctomicrobium piriforme]|uniref:Uncharacterized protein n=1 Tax=Planctomicrobium piriforme TaxID=1576369 RepID=A0A1I3BGU5_9PLAN|nr:hypothetical protein SAMN05421753_101448 [Planctomicrobium piriforme]